MTSKMRTQFDKMTIVPLRITDVTYLISLGNSDFFCFFSLQKSFTTNYPALTNAKNLHLFGILLQRHMIETMLHAIFVGLLFPLHMAVQLA